MRHIKQLTRWILLLSVACIGLSSCDGTRQHESSSTQISISGINRQILSLDENPMRIDVVVNNGPVQRFDIPAGEVNSNIRVGGVLIGELNTIQITWTEIFNGFDVTLAVQNDEFIAQGNVVIDAPYVSGSFDNDGDGIPNLQEREDQSCVWYANNECLDDNIQDVPPNDLIEPTPELVAPPGEPVPVDEPPSLDEFFQTGTLVANDSINFSNSANILTNGDFSNGSDAWNVLEPTAMSGDAVCVDFSAGMDGQFGTVLFQDGFPFEEGEYVVQFDVRASRDTVVSAGVYRVTPYTVRLDHTVIASTDWATKTILFSVEDDLGGFGILTPAHGLTFLAIRTSIETTYCFDNVVLARR